MRRYIAPIIIFHEEPFTTPEDDFKCRFIEGFDVAGAENDSDKLDLKTFPVILSVVLDIIV
jgi:hypothetical protein